MTAWHGIPFAEHEWFPKLMENTLLSEHFLKRSCSKSARCCGDWFPIGFLSVSYPWIFCRRFVWKYWYNIFIRCCLFLFGGSEHFLFFHILGMSSSRPHNFQRGGETYGHSHRLQAIESMRETLSSETGKQLGEVPKCTGHFLRWLMCSVCSYNSYTMLIMLIDVNSVNSSEYIQVHFYRLSGQCQ